MGPRPKQPVVICPRCRRRMATKEYKPMEPKYPSGEHRGLGGTAALDGGLARPALGECGDVLGQPIDVEDMGMEVVREPFFEFAMALVVGIGDGLEEFGIAPGTADVLGRLFHVRPAGAFSAMREIRMRGGAS